MIAVLWWGCGAGATPQAPPAPAVDRGVEALAAGPLRERLFAPSPGGRVVNFWATWCQPCLAELPHLKTLAAAHPEVEVVMVSLDLPKLRQSKVEPFVRENGLTAFTHLQLDEPDAIAALRTVVPEWPDAIPVTLVVDRSGAIVRRHAGQLDAAEAAALIP